MVKIKILVFGNPLIEEDKIALKIVPFLVKKFPNIKFIEFDSVEEIQEYGKDLIIIDAAKGLKAVTIVEDLNLLETKNIVSMHDFDLAYNLKIMKKVGLIKSVKIIAIPMQMKKDEALKEVEKVIKSILSSENS